MLSLYFPELALYRATILPGFPLGSSFNATSQTGKLTGALIW